MKALLRVFNKEKAKVGSFSEYCKKFMKFRWQLYDLAVELGPEHGEDADVLLHGLGQLVGRLLRRGVAQVDAVILQDLNQDVCYFNNFWGASKDIFLEL